MSTDSEATPTAPSINPGILMVAIVIAGAVSWLGYSNPPVTWRIPDDMLHIGALSPPEEQAKLSAVMTANLWKNTLLKFSLAGTGLGLAGILVCLCQAGRGWLGAIVTFVSGPISGAVAGSIGLLVRQYLDKEYPIPLVTQASRPLVADSITFGVVSILLLIPIAIFLGMRPTAAERQKALSVPLAGVLTGLLVPLLAATVLPADTSTHLYPPAGMGLTRIWFAAMSVLSLVMIMFTGSKRNAAVTTEKSAAKESAQEHDAVTSNA